MIHQPADAAGGSSFAWGASLTRRWALRASLRGPRPVYFLDNDTEPFVVIARSVAPPPFKGRLSRRPIRP